MSLLSWFDTREASAFGVTLAQRVLRDLPPDIRAEEKRFAKRAEKSLLAASRDLQAFKRTHSLNMLQKAKLGNAFLWTLREAGYDADYAGEVTHWMTMQL